MARVLVSSAGRRRYVVEELVRSAADADVVIAADMNRLAPALYVNGAEAFVVAGETVEDRVGCLIEYITSNEVDAVLSLHDYEGIELGRRQAELAAAGCLFVGPSAESASVALDKVLLADELDAARGSLVPLTISTLNELEKCLSVSEQWVLKDRHGSASSGLRFAKAERLLDIAASLDSGTWVAQPAIAGVEYNVDLFVDSAGAITGRCVKRKWDMRAGETDSATVLLNPPAEVEAAAIECISQMEVLGNVDVDVILTPEGGARVIDINPRFGGGYAFSLLAGYDAAGSVWQLAKRQRVDAIRPMTELTAAKYVAASEVAIPDNLHRGADVFSE